MVIVFAACDLINLTSDSRNLESVWKRRRFYFCVADSLQLLINMN